MSASEKKCIVINARSPLGAGVFYELSKTRRDLRVIAYRTTPLATSVPTRDIPFVGLPRGVACLDNFSAQLDRLAWAEYERWASDDLAGLQLQPANITFEGELAPLYVAAAVATYGANPRKDLSDPRLRRQVASVRLPMIWRYQLIDSLLQGGLDRGGKILEPSERVEPILTVKIIDTEPEEHLPCAWHGYGEHAERLAPGISCHVKTDAAQQITYAAISRTEAVLGGCDGGTHQASDQLQARVFRRSLELDPRLKQVPRVIGDFAHCTITKAHEISVGGAEDAIVLCVRVSAYSKTVLAPGIMRQVIGRIDELVPRG